LFATALPTSGTVPPSGQFAARRNTALNAIQTVPAGSSYVPLMATLQNNSEAARSFIVIGYDLLINNAAAAVVVEEIPGHAAYFSLTGQPGSWQPIPSVSGIGDPGSMSAVLNLGFWEPGSLLYILWVDDNGSAGRSSTAGANTEGAFLIDNFIGFFEVTPVEIVTEPVSQTVLQGTPASLSVEVTGLSPTFRWYKNGVVVPNRSPPPSLSMRLISPMPAITMSS
jgi:hypothetical protein